MPVPSLSPRSRTGKLHTVPSLLLLAVALVFLSLHPVGAATPSSGTVSVDNPMVTWTGDPGTPTATATCNGPNDPACDNFRLDVIAPTDPYTLEIVITPQGADDYDVELYGPDGTKLGDSGNAPGSAEQIAIFDAPSGSYTVAVANYAAVLPHTGVASISLRDGGGGPGDPADGPTFAIHVPPDGVGRNAGEPSIGANWESDRAMYIAGLETLRVDFDDCTSPARATWTDVSYVTTSITTLDPILFTDRETGRTLASQLGPKCSALAFSDDDGESWLPSQGCGINSGVDHQTVGGGPFHEPLTRDPDGLLYPNAVYYCSQDIAIAQCARSDDGGLTFGPAVPMYDLTECGGLHGHVKVAPDGTVYVPNKGCNGEQAAVVSVDNGITWDVRRVPGTSSGTWDPSVGIAVDGTAYIGMTNGGRPFVAVSHDQGVTWESLQDVGLGVGPNGGDILNTAFPVVAAGDGDRAAFGFLGAEQGGDGGGDDPRSPHIWHAYVAFTYDGGETWTTVNVDPEDPVQRGTVFAGGFDPNGSATRNLLDFNDMTIDEEGRVMFAYADGCVGSCSKAAPNSGTEVATIARQTTGKRMFAAFDAVTVPAAPLVEAAILDQGTPDERVRVSWSEPFDGNSPILSYEVYRRRADEPAASLLTTTDSDTRSHDDETTLSGFDYFYAVVAVNASGAGASCGEVLARAAGDGEPEDHCTPPGITVATDPLGDTTLQAGGDPSLDLTRVSMTEPTDASNGEKLVVTITVDDLSVPHPSAAWRAVWTSPDGQRRFVSFESCDQVAGLQCSYGTFDGTLYSAAGDPEGCTFDASGDIEITVDKSLVGISDATDAGTALAGVEGITQVFVGTLCSGLLSPADSAGPGSYLLRSNASCSEGAPVANDDSAATIEGRPVVIDVLANDASSNGSLTVTGVGDPANGSTGNNGDGTVTYLPDSGFTGVDSFTYTVKDEAGLSDSATVTVTVDPECPPVAEGSFSDDFEPGAEPGWQVDTPVNTLGPLSPAWAVVTDTAASSPTHSYSTDAVTLDEKDDRLVAPAQDLSATSHLTFRHRFETEATYDGGVLEVSTDGGSTWIDVLDGGGIFDAGGYNGQIDAGFGSAIAGRQAWTGGSADDPMSLVDVDLGAYTGQDVLVRFRLVTDPFAPGAVPGAGWWIDDVTFTNTLVPGQCPVNRAPVARDDAARTEEDQPVTVPVLDNDEDPDGDAIALTTTGEPRNGTATANGDGTVTYQPDAGFTGEDAFEYEICDYEPLCDTATVTVTVDPAANGAPTVRDDAATTRQDQAVTVDVLANDSDPEGDPLSVASFEQGSNGTVTQEADGSLTYTPDPGFHGSDSFGYTACDPEPACDDATVTVTVTPADGEAGKVSGGGSIPSSTGDGTANLGFSARAGGSGAEGRLSYDGGSGGLGLKGRITALSIAGNGASFSGACTLGDGGVCTFEVDVEDNAASGAGADRFAIEVFDATGATVHQADEVLATGNLRVH